jgi:hypothetical protein
MRLAQTWTPLPHVPGQAEQVQFDSWHCVLSRHTIASLLHEPSLKQ